jgi:hypothetical protein
MTNCRTGRDASYCTGKHNGCQKRTDEAGKNDFEMANLINVGIQAKQEILGALKDKPAALEKVKAVFDKPEYADLFGSEKRLLDIVTGLRLDNNLTDDALAFDPTDMRMWLNWGRDKAKEVVTESPFN